MGIHPEQPSEQCADGVTEVSWEWDAYRTSSGTLRIVDTRDIPACKGLITGRTDLIREDFLVVQDPLRPVHQRVDVLGSGQLRWPLVLHAVFP